MSGGTVFPPAPPPVRQEYEAAFSYPGKGLQDGFEFESPDSYVERVYRAIVAAPRLRPRYTLGKGVAILPWMHRFLSHGALERFFRKLMQVKRTGRARTGT